MDVSFFFFIFLKCDGSVDPSLWEHLAVVSMVIFSHAVAMGYRKENLRMDW